jgi:hypothetical protein
LGLGGDAASNGEQGLDRAPGTEKEFKVQHPILVGVFFGNEGAFGGFQRPPLDQIDKPFPFRPGKGAGLSHPLGKENEKNSQKADFHKLSMGVFDAEN